MNNNIIKQAASSLLLFAAVVVRGDESKDVPAQKPDGPAHRLVIHGSMDNDGGERVPVTFLGVETAPVGPALASQLGLADDTGLVVVHVAEDSPAAAGLKRHDVLTKLDDQILVDTRQLSALVRSHKEGDEVALTLYRGGKEQTFKVKLGKRALPRMMGMDDFGPGSGHSFQFFGDDDQLGEARLRELPGLARDDVNNVMRMIGRDHGNWFGTPGVRVFQHRDGQGSTILNLKDGNFAFSDDNGSIEVNAANGKREITVKNAKGAVTFKGPINSDDERKKLPADVVARLNGIEKMDFSYEAGDDFKQDATAVTPPDKTKISLLPAPADESNGPNRPF